jgi:hypothetical protein
VSSHIAPPAHEPAGWKTLVKVRKKPEKSGVFDNATAVEKRRRESVFRDWFQDSRKWVHPKPVSIFGC